MQWPFDGRTATDRQCGKIVRPVLRVAVLAIILNTACFCQTSESEEGGALGVPWLGLDSISVYSTYTNGLGVLGSDTTVGGATTLHWSNVRENSDYSINYTGSYTRDVHFAALSGLSDQLSVNVGRHLGSRWDFRFSAAANIVDLNQLPFSQSFSSALSGVTGSFTDITSGLLSGKSGNSQVQSLLNGTQALVSPTLLLYGGRAFSSSAQISLGYSISPLTSIQFDAGGTRVQRLSAGTDASADTASLLFQTTTANAGITISHSLNPRTEVSMGVQTSRTFVAFPEAYYSYGTVSLSRVLSQRWFASLGGGGGLTTPVRHPSSASAAEEGQYVADGTIGFKSYEHTFFATGNRSFADTYGLGAASIISGSGGWTWSRPGSGWRSGATFTQQRIAGIAFPVLNAWQADISLQRTLSEHTSLRAEYAYLRLSGGPALATALSPGAVRVSLVWSPGLSLLPR
jgi:hypothetical protein